jgi:hypothetical protein
VSDKEQWILLFLSVLSDAKRIHLTLPHPASADAALALFVARARAESVRMGAEVDKARAKRRGLVARTGGAEAMARWTREHEEAVWEQRGAAGQAQEQESGR